MTTGRGFLRANATVLFVAAWANAAPSGDLTAALCWRAPNNTQARETLGSIEVSKVAGQGLWIAFERTDKGTCPVVFMTNQAVRAKASVEQATGLWLELTYNDMIHSLPFRVCLFDKDRPFGPKAASLEDSHHVLVLNGPLAAGEKPLADLARVPNKAWVGPFARTHDLAVQYAVQADTKARGLQDIFKVQTRYDLPRLIATSEQWLDIPKPAQKKERSRDLFGGALDSVAEEIGGESQGPASRVPIYCLDVLLDEVEARGPYVQGFQAARSMTRDILEGEVLYATTGGRRRVLTASVVFSQMAKNVASKRAQNRLVKVTSETLPALDTCVGLWPACKAGIQEFLKSHRDWHVIIPERPVLFYQGDAVAYAMLAWFQVHPASGRMVGIMPDGSHGAVSDEMARLEQTLIETAKDKVGSSGGAVRGFFSQVAGMYVSSAGILDAVGLTICDPNLANLDDAQWRAFVAGHALDFCQRFLEEHADLYDSYDARLGFWQGAMVITAELGGRDAAVTCARNAARSVVDKAVSDAKARLEERAKEARQMVQAEARAAWDELADKHAPEIKKVVEGVEALGDLVGQATDLKTTTEDYRKRGQAVWEEVRGRFKP